jgi:hypothetical protein
MPNKKTSNCEEQRKEIYYTMRGKVSTSSHLESSGRIWAREQRYA